MEGKGEKTRISDITQLMNRRKEIFERQMFFGLIEGLEVRKKGLVVVCVCVSLLLGAIVLIGMKYEL